MKPASELYREISSQWICVAVYLWLLELHVAIGTDSEPVIAWLADSAAILLTIVFWGYVACIPLTVIGVLIGRVRMLSLNRVAVRACLVVVTAIHFARWCRI